MPTLKIPTPLRAYAGGQSVIQVSGDNVAAALADLTAQHPRLNQHIFNESGELRPFVNLFINDEDVRYLEGANTPVKETDLLRIIPSIAGGSEASAVQIQKVDHAGLRTNQSLIIAFNILAFVLNRPDLAVFVTLVMLAGTLMRMPGFGVVYRLMLKPLGIVNPDVIEDNPEPHLFAQAFGVVVMVIGSFALYANALSLGWGLIWVVTALAALNLFGGFCVGCAIYYWFNRLKIPGFVKTPPVGSVPGMRPKRTGQ